MKHARNLSLPILVAYLMVTALTIIALPFVAVASNITTAVNYATILVVNNNTTTSLTNQSSNITGLNSPNLISSGFVNASVSNLAMQYNGTDITFMPGYGTNAWMVWVPQISASTQLIDVLYMGGSVNGGKEYYFPGATGMTTADSATMEFGSNFSIRQTGYINPATGTSKFLVEKPGAFDVLNIASGNVTARIYAAPATINTGGALVSFYNLSTGNLTRAGERLNAFPEGTITSVNFNFQNAGAPTGTAYCTVRKVSDDSLLGIIGTLDVSTIIFNAFVGWDYVFSGGSAYVPSAQDIRVQVEWAGTGGADEVRVTYDNTNPYAGGVGTHYNGAVYTDDAAADTFNTIVTYSTPTGAVVSKAVSSGEHTINAYADSVNLGISVDGGAATTTALGGATVQNNATTWNFCLNDAIPYLASQNVTIGGNPRQNIAWQYGTTFTDQTGNGHTATPSFATSSSSAYLSASLASFQPVSQAQASIAAFGNITGWLGSPNMTSQFSSNTSNVTWPGADIFKALATSSSTPTPLIFVTLAMFLILICSLTLSWGMSKIGGPSNFVKLIVVSCLMGVANGVGAFDFWMVLAYILIALSLVFAGSKKGWI